MATALAIMTVLDEWFRAHHPDELAAQDFDRWPYTLPFGHTTDQLTTALDEWHTEHPDTPPRPAHIAERIKAPGARQRSNTIRSQIRSALLTDRTTGTLHEQLLDRQRRRIAALSRLTVHVDELRTGVVDARALAGQDAPGDHVYELTELVDGTWTYDHAATPMQLGELLWHIVCRYDPLDDP